MFDMKNDYHSYRYSLGVLERRVSIFPKISLILSFFKDREEIIDIFS